MSNTPRILLVLGAGSNLRPHLHRVFAARGYKVALASRKGGEGTGSNTNEENVIHIKADFTDPAAVGKVFAKTKEVFGASPGVVIYNAYNNTPTSDTDPLSTPLAAFASGLNVNTISTFTAAQLALTGFAELPETASKTFIYTGNMLNVATAPQLLTLGVGKRASAYVIEAASMAYKDKGYKFYFTDEREEDGTPMWNGVSGSAGAEYYFELAEGKEQGPWLQTFVKDIGYKSFQK